MAHGLLSFYLKNPVGSQNEDWYYGQQGLVVRLTGDRMVFTLQMGQFDQTRELEKLRERFT